MEWLSDGLYPTRQVGSSPGTFLFEPAKARIFSRVNKYSFLEKIDLLEICPNPVGSLESLTEKRRIG